MTSVIQQRLRAWHESLCPGNIDNLTLEVSRRSDRPSLRLDAPHCAELVVNFRGGADKAVAATQLGEVLRVVALTTAPHVDPLVLNTLWDADGVCTMGASLCARCDEMGLLQEAIVNLAVRDEDGARSGPGLIHDAIYKWDERAASATFTQLHDTLRAPDGPTTSPPPPVQLRLVLGQYLEDDHDDAMCLRDLQALLVRAREPTHDCAHRFRIARLIPQGRTADIARRHCPAILTTIVNSGIVMQLKPLPSNQVPGEEQSPWQWLLDWAKASQEASRLGELVIETFDGQTTDTLVKLLDLVVTKSATLQHLTLYWPLNSVDLDAEQRCRAAEATGAAISAPRSPVRLKTLMIDLGDLTDDDAGALVRGAAILPVCSNEDESSATARFDSVKWAPQATSEACIGQVVRLFGAVGVRQLEINSGFRGLASKILKAVLQSCPQLTKLEWWELLCDDFSELEDAT